MLTQLPIHWILDMVEEIDVKNEKVFLTSKIKDILWNIERDYKFWDILIKHNILPKNKILFYWEPWNWKTTTAQYLAKLLDLPLIKAKNWSIIKSSMWQSGQNIEKIFSQIKWPCVFFVDEIDNFCNSRTWNNESSAGTENDRIVNAFILGLDQLDRDIIFVWATNMINSLDPAIKRRFEVKKEIPQLNEKDKVLYAKELFKHYKIKKHDFDFECLKKYKTFSELDLTITDFARNFIIAKSKII